MDDYSTKENDKVESPIALLSHDLLTTSYDVTRAIFRHLPIRSIDSCSLVCQSWTPISRLIKSHRHTIHTLTYPSDPLSPTVTCSNLLHDFDQFISLYINNNLWSLPTFALVVSTNILASKGFYSSANSPLLIKHSRRIHSETGNLTRINERFDISQALTKHLNKSCKVLMIAADGIIASTDNNQSYEIESNDAIGILFLPHFPPDVLGIYPFEIPSNTQIASDMSRSELHRFLGSVPDDVQIRCVIFFFVQRQSYAVDCIKKLLEYYPSQVAIIGGFVDKINYDDRQIHTTKVSYDACGIVITGDKKRLHIGEILLENHIRTREQIRNKLNELKSLDNNHCLSFAIQISCIARGSNYYNDEQNVECSEFRKLFPNTPLIGVFGNGELGHDYLPNYNQTITKQQTGKNLFRGYSTVFSLISLHM
ncbi:unnamed protein product [Rotaria sordida]|uniref:FIST C-domain domain-containing protein n=1 Tax=Rotaria sordida TaxID=392033 RepID=A0A818Y7S8_9BILA|nr:unnamed protein product [Rotaria sordida]